MEAFDRLKQMLTTAPRLAHSKFSQPFIIDTDASDLAIGSVLSQKIDKYCVTRKELLALVYFVKYFRHYLYGREFIVSANHGSLFWLMNFKNPEGQVARWLEVLSTYNFKVEHRPGRLHGNADSLSRKPVSPCNKDIHEEVAYEKENQDGQCLQLSITETAENDRDLIKLQHEDEDLARVRTWVENNERPCSKILQHAAMYSTSL